ncbi:helix-turn-helix transcriptional regulator [Dorea sp. D27]|uniref:helix-turn-helix transcriptional regulator n=1 Tax=Dorea sp. D27 TaxID=658665 RepID=UPI000673479B|nr:YafY family protein [Dorea sp. D27]KMZ52702.1 transcriptional regulator, DeoR family [Dorea sp. D27]
MSKADRLIEMMITINAKKHFTVGELAEEFSVSKRTVLRDLQSLERAGFPLYSEVGAAGGYHVLKERVLPPITFSENEAKAIFFAYQSMQFYRNVPFEQEGISVLKKFLNCLPPDMQNSITQIQNKVVFWVPDRHCSSPLLRDLLDIVTNGWGVTVRYSSEHSESVRTIVPIGLYAMNGLWYCPTYCMKAMAVREFRVDRIEEIIEIIKKPVMKAPMTVHEYLDRKETGNDYHVRIWLSALGVKRCEADFLLARGLEIFNDGTGMIDMEIAGSSLALVADFLLPLGTDAEVLAPEELKDEMGRKAEALYHHYCMQEG